jgi:Protein of unknown function (DUF3667)
MHQTNCTNCGTELTGPFCSQCGQKETHRYTAGHVLHELVHVFTHADKGIFSFAWNIIHKPGTIALDMVEGRRKRYFNLFQYLLLVVGFVTFIMVKADFMSAVMKNINTANSTKMSSNLAAVQMEAGQLLQKYMNIFQMLLIPVYAFFSWLIIGRKKYNYAEYIVLHTASSAQTNTIALITTPLLLVSMNATLISFQLFISLGILIFSFALCYRQFFKFSLLKSTLYALLVFVCSYIVQIFITTLFIAVIAIVHLKK